MRGEREKASINQKSADQRGGHRVARDVSNGLEAIQQPGGHPATRAAKNDRECAD